MNRPTPVSLPDATEHVRQLKAGLVTPVELVSTYLGRLNAQHSRLNGAAHILHDDALKAAEAVSVDGVLAGLPISVKETFGLAGNSITAGSRRRRPSLCEADSVAVARLKAAGAIVIARSNVPELAMAGETDNFLFGRTNNAHNPHLVAGGSSGGEGALVASGSSAAGIGSDILGSIRIPAAFNGIVGFKPASTAIPKTGTWPQIDGFLNSMLAIGPLTRSVRDAKLLYEVLADQKLDEGLDFGRIRLILPDPFELKINHASIAGAVAHAQTELELAGLTPEKVGFPEVGALYQAMLGLLSAELTPQLNQELTTAAGERFSLARESLAQLRGKPTIYDGLFQLLVVAPLLRPNPKEIPALKETIAAARRRIREILGADGILLLPTLGIMAPRHKAMNRSSLRPGVNGTMTPLTFCNQLDLPAIALPAWVDRDHRTGLPPSVMLVCAPGAEATLLRVAAFLETKLLN